MMKHEEVIQLLREQNERLLTILEKFADKDINIVVNSYNGAYGESSVDNNINGDNRGIVGRSGTANTLNDITDATATIGAENAINYNQV